VYLVWVLNDETAQAVWMMKLNEQLPQPNEINPEDLLAATRAGQKQAIFGTMFSIILAILVGRKYAENIEYLKKKAEEESNLIANC